MLVWGNLYSIDISEDFNFLEDEPPSPKRPRLDIEALAVVDDGPNLFDLANADFVKPFLTLLPPKTLVQLQLTCRTFCYLIDANRRKLKKCAPPFVDLEFRRRGKREPSFGIILSNTEFRNRKHLPHIRFVIQFVSHLELSVYSSGLALEDNEVTAKIVKRTTCRRPIYDVFVNREASTANTLRLVYEFLTTTAEFTNVKITSANDAALEVLGEMWQTTGAKLNAFEVRRHHRSQAVQMLSLHNFMNITQPLEFEARDYPNDYFTKDFFSGAGWVSIRKLKLSICWSWSFEPKKCELTDEHLAAMINLRKLKLEGCVTELTSEGLADWITRQVKAGAVSKLLCRVRKEVWLPFVSILYRRNKKWNLQNADDDFHYFHTENGHSIRLRRDFETDDYAEIDLRTF